MVELIGGTAESSCVEFILQNAPVGLQPYISALRTLIGYRHHPAIPVPIAV